MRALTHRGAFTPEHECLLERVELLVNNTHMEITTRAKRAFETLETAPYKRQVLPKLNAELGVPADPRRLAPPTDPSLPSGAPTPMPTTSASNKKSNVQIPYARVTRDAEALGVVGTPVFVRANIGDPLTVSMPDERIDAVAGMDAVNAELATRHEDDDAWRVSGVLLSTESEMDPVLQDMGVRNTSTTTTILEAVQGPTQLRNLYSSRPLIGDYVYIGLLWGSSGTPGYTWKPFCSQHLDMEFLPEQPRAPQLGFAGHAKHKLLHVEFSDDDRQRLCRAVCLGRVIDSAPSPGMITVNVAIREMSVDELGRRHDEEHVVYTPVVDTDVDVWRQPVETTRWDYTGTIGRRCPARVVAAAAPTPPEPPAPPLQPPPPPNRAQDQWNTLRALLTELGYAAAVAAGAAAFASVAGGAAAPASAVGPTLLNGAAAAALAAVLAYMKKPDTVDDTDSVLQLADLLVRLPPAPSTDPMLRLRPVAAALAQDATLEQSMTVYASSLVPALLDLARRPTEPINATAQLQRAALELEVYFTRAESLVAPDHDTLPVRALALARTAIGTRKDADASVWALQRAAVVLGAIDALLLAGV